MAVPEASLVKQHADLIRRELAARGFHHASHVPVLRLHLLFCRVGRDAALAADALIQWPRPEWLVGLCGAYPLVFEDCNPSDIADPKRPGAW